MVGQSDTDFVVLRQALGLLSLSHERESYVARAALDRIEQRTTEVEMERSMLGVFKADLAKERETWTDEYGTVWTRPTAWAYQQACRALHRAESELAARDRQIAAIKVALLRAANHGVSGDWYCGGCSYDLKIWIGGGMTGPLPELCPLCRHEEVKGEVDA